MVDREEPGVLRRAVVAIRQNVATFWDAILVMSAVLIAPAYVSALSAGAQGPVYLILMSAALYVVLRRLYPIARENAHLYWARLGLRPRRASPAYVRALFDGYADDFDRHLMVELAYNVPNLIVGVVSDRIGGGSGNGIGNSAPVVLELGCGTGICGPLLAPLAGSLTGVDLSPKMLAMAENKSCYDRLVEADLCDFLKAHRETVDLCVAADVLVYLGELDEVFAGVRRVLRSGGLFAFTVEAIDDRSWRLRKSGRYAHSRTYVEDRARAVGFEVVESVRAALRTQGHVPVAGDVWLLRKPV